MTKTEELEKLIAKDELLGEAHAKERKLEDTKLRTSLSKLAQQEKASVKKNIAPALSAALDPNSMSS